MSGLDRGYPVNHILGYRGNLSKHVVHEVAGRNHTIDRCGLLWSRIFFSSRLGTATGLG